MPIFSLQENTLGATTNNYIILSMLLQDGIWVALPSLFKPVARGGATPMQAKWIKLDLRREKVANCHLLRKQKTSFH